MTEETLEVDATVTEFSHSWQVTPLSLWAKAWCSEVFADTEELEDGSYAPDRVAGEIAIRAMLDAGMILRREE
jgi:hypothetical protein